MLDCTSKHAFVDLSLEPHTRVMCSITKTTLQVCLYTVVAMFGTFYRFKIGSIIPYFRLIHFSLIICFGHHGVQP